MKPLPVLIVQNEPRESGGLIESVLTRRQIPFQSFDLKAGDPFPDPASGSALVVLGGPDSANDTTLLMKRELEQVGVCLEKGIPYLGICLGLQVMVKAAGGQVLKSPVKEIGFLDADGRPYEVEITAEGAKDPLFHGFRKRHVRVFQLHGETVALTPATMKAGKPAMRLLGVSHGVPNQIVRVGRNAYGIQCHFELTPELFETWAREDADLKKTDAAALRGQFKSFEKEYLETGVRLVENFFKIASIGNGTGFKTQVPNPVPFLDSRMRGNDNV